MAVTAQDVRAHVGASATNDTQLANLLTVAQILLDQYVADAVVSGTVIPPEIMDRALLLVAAELWAIDRAPNGVLNQQFDGPDGAQSVPVRISADALRPVPPLLAPWVLPVIA